MAVRRLRGLAIHWVPFRIRGALNWLDTRWFYSPAVPRTEMIKVKYTYLLDLSPLGTPRSLPTSSTDFHTYTPLVDPGVQPLVLAEKRDVRLTNTLSARTRIQHRRRTCECSARYRPLESGGTHAAGLHRAGRGIGGRRRGGGAVCGRVLDVWGMF